MASMFEEILLKQDPDEETEGGEGEEKLDEGEDTEDPTEEDEY